MLPPGLLELQIQAVAVAVPLLVHQVPMAALAS
jgi:hypothetical protein